MDHHKMPVGQLWNSILDAHLAELSGAELKVLCYILRHTIGFEKVSDSISLDQFQHGILRRDGSRFDAGVGLSKKPLLAALRSLGERQLLVVERRRERGKGHLASIYSVQPVKEKMALLSRATSPESAPEKGQKYTNALGEKLPQVQGITVQGKTDHQGSVASTKPPVAVCCPPATPDDDASKNLFRGGKKRERPCLTDEQLQLLERMQANGVSSSQAHRVLQQARPERIRQSLEYLPYRNAKNPAGYFVREVLSEDFAAPKVLRLDKQREDVKQRRKQEEFDQAEAKRAEEEAYRAQRQAAYEALQPDQLRELVEEARRRAVWARNRPEMLAEDSPVLQGLVLDLVDEGWLEKRLGRRESKLNLPPPRGWAESRRGRNQAREARA